MTRPTRAKAREEVPPMRERQLALWFLAAVALVVGVWAQFAPASFYSSFPGGRGWVAADGPYNEHLIRDIGGLNLALMLITAAAARAMRPGLVRLAAGATLLYAVPHLIYHATHLQPYGTADAVGNVAGLTLGVLLPLWLVITPGKATAAPSTPARSEATNEA
jgi:hypothetical protein